MKSVSATLLAGIIGCALVQPASAAKGAKDTENVVHSFGSGTDGQYAAANLINANGTLYGTTERGGASGNGAVFAIDQKTGKETVLYSFCSQQNCADGQYSSAGLIDVKGILYGVTELGGASGAGTVFSLDPGTGAETVIYSFAGGATGDGWNPGASLIDVNGTLYGITTNGGTHVQNAQGYGTVFAVDPKTGKETVLHAFCSQQNCTDGGLPGGSLIEVNGKLYGTTSNDGATFYTGTVFSIDLKSNAFAVVYSFCSQANCTDGATPYAGLIDVKGTFYGTTSMGGANNAGTVYALDPTTGAEGVLYSFCSQNNCDDGGGPLSDLIDVKGKLYGTTPYGGAGDDGGALFAVDAKSGKEKVLYSFCSQPACADGQTPDASLIDVKGTLYGTTQNGGAAGDGTVFTLTK